VRITSREGVIMVGGDGISCRCYPIFATYVGDYPEQVLVMLVKTGHCPVCPAPPKESGTFKSIGPPHKISPIHSALKKICQGPAIFAWACLKAGIKPVQEPFWLNLPFVNIYDSITPDILHQLYQGVVKHVVNWIRMACGDVEIGARCWQLPPNHHIMLFMKGITNLSCVTGSQHDQICHFLLSLILNIRLPDGTSSARLVRAVRALLDFLNLARYPIHTSETLDNLDSALRDFHDNKLIFVDLGIRQNFNIPKLHYIGHYRYFFERFGSGDNFNTEYTERLHIDMAKQAYRASNRKDEYPQMTAWLDRREKMMHHAKFIRWHLAASNPNHVHVQIPAPSLIPHQTLKLPKHPSIATVSLHDLKVRYGAIHFVEGLSDTAFQG
jgi:hypothetical protein